MKAEYINPFIKASTQVLKQMTKLDFTTGSPYLSNSPHDSDSIVVVVGLIGELTGKASFTMGHDIAKVIASGMMMGHPIEEINEMATSAISELSNMIMGNASTLLFNEGFTTDITTPSVMVGDDIKVSNDGMQTIGVPLISERGSLALDISIKD